MNRVGAVIAASAVVALLSACTVTVHGSQPRSLTPRITAGESAPGLSDGLLTDADLTAVPGLPPDVHVVAIEQTEVYENPDPRGPCGAKLGHSPDTSGAAQIGVTGTDLQGFQTVLRLPEPDARELLTAAAAEATEGCAPFTSQTNLGETQTTQMVDVVPLELTVDQGLAYVELVTTSGGSNYVTAISLRHGGVYSGFGAFSVDRPDPDMVTGLAAAAQERLLTVH